MKWLALVIPLAGCFYFDPINQRPSVDIEPGSADPVFRGAPVHLHAVIDDPEGEEDNTKAHWTVQLCTDATSPSGCDPGPAYFTGDNHDADFLVPITRADDTTPVTSLLVELDATDPGGASARPPSQLVIPVSDHPPVVEFPQPRSLHNFVVGAPIDLFAKITDPDDGPKITSLMANVMRDMKVVVTPNVTSPFTFTDLPEQDLANPPSIVVGKRFTPQEAGVWMVQATATDSFPVTTTQLLTITINLDHAPCLEQVQPIVPPAGDVLPVFEPTLFEVQVVTDDLDVYPPRTDDNLFGTTTFSWTVKPPGGTRQPAGTGSSVAFDPAAYKSGDIVEIRVEIADRQHTPIQCTDTDPTCSVISDDTCIQRQTWRVEVQ